MIFGNRISLVLVGAGLGAASAYFLDPQRGRRRRHVVDGRVRRAVRDVEKLADKARRDLEHRAQAPGGVGLRPTGSVLRADAPARRIAEGAAGSVLALYGVLRGGLTGLGAIFAGASLVARATVQRKDGIILVQKTMTIEAPVERVFDLWSRFENFPRFMRHVDEITTAGDRSHWRVRGPAGVPVEWDAEITERIANRRLAWKSVEGSVVEQHGEIIFERLGDARTRIDVVLAYDPPGGALGHAVAGLFQSDPKTLMDDDLLRLKSLLEDGKATGREGQVTAPELH